VTGAGPVPLLAEVTGAGPVPLLADLSAAGLLPPIAEGILGTFWLHAATARAMAAAPATAGTTDVTRRTAELNTVSIR